MSKTNERAASEVSNKATTRVLVVIVVVSSFGPYIVSGVRTDQIVIYTLAALLFPITLWRLQISKYAALLGVSWSVYIAVALTSFYGGTTNNSPWSDGDALANLDNLVLPMATFFVVLVLIHNRDPAQVRDDVTLAVSLGTVGSALIGVLQYISPAATGPVIARFGGAGDTAQRAQTLGRLTGIFGQPSSAGAAYTLGILCALYAFRRRPVLQATSAAIIIVGGVLTVSKAFLLIGLPLACWVILRSRRGRGTGRLIAVGLATIGVYATGGALGLASDWSGWDRLVRLLPWQEGISFRLYTGDRYGSSSSTSPLIEAVLREHPFVGFGVSGLETPTDTLLVQALSLAGLIGVASTLVALGLIIRGYWAQKENWDCDTAIFYGPVALALVVLSFGTPALTANRTSVIAWTLLALMLGSTSTSYYTKGTGSGVRNRTKLDAPDQRYLP